MAAVVWCCFSLSFFWFSVSFPSVSLGVAICLMSCHEWVLDGVGLAAAFVFCTGKSRVGSVLGCWCLAWVVYERDELWDKAGQGTSPLVGNTISDGCRTYHV